MLNLFKLVLYTGTRCSKCPKARELVREVARELNWKEGIDFLEKIIDGAELKPSVTNFEGQRYNLVLNPEDINTDNVPAALVGEDFTIEALMLQIASTPSIVINDEAVFVGKIPTKEELLEEIKKRI